MDRPVNGKGVVGSKWVLRIKRSARLVAKGYTQREGENYTETFAPTLRFESLRTVVAYASSEGLFMEQMDVSTTFLYANIDEEVYMEIPEGIEGHGTGKVMVLQKSIYGLKQA